MVLGWLMTGSIVVRRYMIGVFGGRLTGVLTGVIGVYIMCHRVKFMSR